MKGAATGKLFLPGAQRCTALPLLPDKRIVLTVSYSILFRQNPLDQLDALAPVVTQVFGGTDYDARSRLRRGWGFLERNATEEDARTASEAIGDLAGGVTVIDNAQLRTPADPQVMKAFEFAPTGISLQLQSPQKPECLVEWADVDIVAAGSFLEEVIRRESRGDEQTTGKLMMGLGIFMVTGIPMGIFGGGKKKKKETKPVKSSRVITFGRIVSKSGAQFAFSPDHFDFSGLGDQKQMNAAANLRLFLAELAQRTSAKLNVGTRLLLGNRSLTFANYTGLQDFETELLWLMNV
ncbi:MAG TPA: hypothetical protein VL171_15900 [Verrucomicrobiae bacterium]|nr:hypothetical protein [Verrucomicrobiae bacterium]